MYHVGDLIRQAGIVAALVIADMAKLCAVRTTGRQNLYAAMERFKSEAIDSKSN
jgi:hypothetical protein